MSKVAGSIHAHMTVGKKAVERVMTNTLKVSCINVFNEVRKTPIGW